MTNIVYHVLFIFLITKIFYQGVYDWKQNRCDGAITCKLKNNYQLTKIDFINKLNFCLPQCQYRLILLLGEGQALFDLALFSALNFLLIEKDPKPKVKSRKIK